MGELRHVMGLLTMDGEGLDPAGEANLTVLPADPSTPAAPPDPPPPAPPSPPSSCVPALPPEPGSGRSMGGDALLPHRPGDYESLVC